jgi:hypothetical protein
VIPFLATYLTETCAQEWWEDICKNFHSSITHNNESNVKNNNSHTEL